MHKTINNKRYFPSCSTHVGTADLEGRTESIYRKKNREFFLVQVFDSGEWDIIPLTDEETENWFKQNSTPEKMSAAFHREKRVRTSVFLDADVHDMAKEKAKQAGMTLGEYLETLITTDVHII